MSLRRSLIVGTAVAGVAFAWASASNTAKATPLPVTNLTFNTFSGTFSPPKDFFTHAAPTGWSIGAPAIRSNLIFVGQQGSETTASNGTYAVYKGTGFSNTVPAGFNFYQADGNPEFESTIFQTVTGLTVGDSYSLTFQQAAGQQQGFSGATTEQWKVFLGQGDIGVSCSTSPCTVVNPHGDEEADSPLMHNPSQGNTNWNPVSLSFKATATSEVLTFLAWGDGGSTSNLPPTVFLEGVNTPAVPEPATLTLLGVGVLGLGGVMARKRSKRSV